MRPARLLALQRGMRQRLGHLEHATQLNGGQPFGIERAVAVVELDSAPIAIAQFRQRIAGRLHGFVPAVNADPCLHAVAHRIAQCRHAFAGLLLEQGQQALGRGLCLPLD